MDFRVCGCELYTMIDFRDTFIQDIGCDGTDISEDIDLKVRVYIHYDVPILEQFHSYICV